MNAWNDFFKAIEWDIDMTEHSISYGHFFMSIQAAIEGRGIAIAPQVLVERDIKAGLLGFAMDKSVESSGQYFLIGRKRSWDQEKIKVFREWLTNEVSNMA